jgi:hypothetical protein
MMDGLFMMRDMGMIAWVNGFNFDLCGAIA